MPKKKRSHPLMIFLRRFRKPLLPRNFPSSRQKQSARTPLRHRRQISRKQTLSPMI